jgi:hypothetical protein
LIAYVYSCVDLSTYTSTLTVVEYLRGTPYALYT